jgi:hypothetical protein
VHDEAADGLQSRSGRIKQTKDRDDDDDDDDDDEDAAAADDDDDDDVVVVVVTYLFTNILVPT